jgi:hypothetical protein
MFINVTVFITGEDVGVGLLLCICGTGFSVYTIEIDTLEYQQTEKIETELKDVDRIHRIRKVYAS